MKIKPVGFKSIDHYRISIAFMRDDVIPAKITTKPRFENGNLRFLHELIPKAVMVKRIPT